MGQQQLLLIVLGVIIVGIAVVVGINVFTASSAQANRDGVTSDLVNLASLAQTYYRKPAALGGGDRKFTNWSIPPSLTSTPNGTYTITTTADKSLLLTGTGTELDGGTTITVKMQVDTASFKVIP